MYLFSAFHIDDFLFGLSCGVAVTLIARYAHGAIDMSRKDFFDQYIKKLVRF